MKFKVTKKQTLAEAIKKQAKKQGRDGLAWVTCNVELIEYKFRILWRILGAACVCDAKYRLPHANGWVIKCELVLQCVKVQTRSVHFIH